MSDSQTARPLIEWGPTVDEESCTGCGTCIDFCHQDVYRWSADESLTGIWAGADYAAFRDRVRCFDFPPCTDCGCELAADNREDCLGNPHPTCGDCLWARGIIRCP